MYVYKRVYADGSNGYNRSERRDICRRLIAYAHGERDGESIGSTRAFHGAESTSRDPAQEGYGKTTEKKRLVTVRQHFLVPDALLPLPVSLSFIVQGGRPLSPIYITLILYPFGQRFPRFSTYRILLPRIQPLYPPTYSIQ